MKIAITQRSKNLNELGRTDSLEQNYINFFKSFGVTIISIPNSLPDPVSYFKDIGATHLVLSGGGDICPEFYKGKVIKGVEYSRDRDITEKKLLNYAVKNKIPVLGICRGCEFINVYFGGGLIQNLRTSYSGAIEHVRVKHRIKLIDNKIQLVAKSRNITVNSYHNDGFTYKELSKKLINFAEAEDGVIEGCYHESLPIVGVMWHPERRRPITAFDSRLISLYINKKFFWK
jgi:putative glutamine amidotransferase